MEKIFGVFLLAVFIIAVGTFTIIYFLSINDNIEKMLKRRGHNSYGHYRAFMDAKARRREKEQLQQLKERISLPKKTNYSHKTAKRQQKKQVDAFYERNIEKKQR